MSFGESGVTVIIEIKKEKVVYWLRWALLPAVILAVLVWCYYSTEFLAKNGLQRRWIEPLAYFQTSFLGAVFVGILVPRWKAVTVLILTVPVGAAGLQLAARFDPITQEPTILPISCGFAGGLIGVLIIAAWEYRNWRRTGIERSELGK